MITKKVFTGGINGDDVDHLMKPNEYLGAMNMRFTTSENGRVGYLSNIEGNVLKNTTPTGTFALPSGTNKTIGAYEDSANRRVYFFNWNYDGNHGIFCYDYDSDQVYTVLLSEDVVGGLNFSDDIHSVAMAYDQLFWTDNNNPPRRINVYSGMKLYHPSLFLGHTAYTSPIEQNVISVIRNQPWAPITIEKQTDNDYSNNFVYKEAFQFAYRFVYRDYETSTFSPLSVLANYNYEDDTYNKIELTIPLDQKIEQDVLKIEVAVRYPVGGKVFIIKTFKDGFDSHNAGSALTFDFYNDSIGIAVDDATANKQYDVVPLRSKTLEIAKDRLFLANNTEAYASPDTTSLTASTTESGSATLMGNWWLLQWIDPDNPVVTESRYLLEINGLTSDNGWYYRQAYPGWPAYYPAPSYPDPVTYPSFVSGNYLGSDYFGILSAFSVDPAWVINFTYDDQQSVVTGATIADLDKTKVFKSDSVYKLGIVFYDESGRKCGVVEGPRVKTPDRTYTSVTFTSGIYWSLSQFSAPTEIPEWATHYAIVVTKSIRTSYFLQARADEIRYAVKKDDGTFDIQAGSQAYSEDFYGLAVKITSLFKYGMGYTYADGDILKLYVSGDSNIYKLKVKSQYGDYVIVDLVDLDVLSTKKALYEIYTPYVQSTYEYYYENGSAYKINNPGLPNRQYSTIVGSISGDVYILERSIGGVNYFTENMSPSSLYWSNWNTNIGRPSIVIDKPILEKKLNIRFSNTKIPGSELNGLCTFDALDETVLPFEMSEINKILLVSKIEAEGTVMLAIGEEETASLYLGESQVFDNKGSSFLAKSSGVIGNINVLRGSFGTRNPESVVRVYGTVYWFDANFGAVVRYDVNGLFPISSNKMFKYFKKVGRDIRDNDLRIYGGLDPYNMEVLMFVPRVSLDPANETLDDQIISTNSFSNDTYYVIDSDDSIVSDGGSNLLVYNPTGDGSYSESVTLTPNRLYKMVISGGTATYNGSPVTNNDYFFAIEEAPTIAISLENNGSYTLYELVRSLYETYDGQGGVWVYKPDLNRWTSVYSYRPDWMCMVGDRLISFKNGYPYLHNSGVYNQFYGRSYDSQIAFLHNEAANITKVYSSVAIEGDTPSRVHIRTEVPYVQSSDALSGTYDPKTRINGDFMVKEGVSYADVYRDRLSPNVNGSYDVKMVKGDPMRGEIGKFQVVFLQPNTLKKIKFVNIGFTQSWGNTTINK